MFSHEKLGVYNKAFALNKNIYVLLKANKTIPFYAKNQLGRACLSIMLNIAEGNSKFSSKDRKNYFVIARGSSTECAAIIQLLGEQGEISNSEKEELYAAFEEISVILFKMIVNLQNKS